MTTYAEVVGAVADYYGTDSDIWRKVATYSGGPMTQSEIAALRQVPGVSVTVDNAGGFRGWDYNNPFPQTNNPISAVDSNVPNSSYGGSSFNGRVNGTYHWDGATQTGRLTSGARNVSTGARVATVAGKINTAVMAVSAGMFLGAKIDSALYNIGKFFDLNPPESLNPATWDSMATTEGGKQLLRTLFHIDDNGNTTMYMPEDMIGYMYDYWNSLNAWSTGARTLTPGQDAGKGVENGNITFLNTTFLHTLQSDHLDRLFTDALSYLNTQSEIITHWYTTLGITPTLHVTSLSDRVIVASDTSISTSDALVGTFYPNGSWAGGGTIGSQKTYTYNNKTVYYHKINITGYGGPYYPVSTPTVNNDDSIAWLSTFGNSTGGAGITGFEPDPNSTQPGTIDPTQPTLPQLKNNMPNQFSNPIKETVPQPDGTNKDIIYYPVPIPKITDDTEKPVTGTPTQGDPEITITDPVDETSPIVDIITNPLPQPSTPTPGPSATPPSTGGGSSPTVTQPTGEASSLWAVYNPTQAQLDAFGAWLWSSNFVDQIKKLFNDPMQAIVGVHKVFATPSTGSQVNIKCGYIDSECPAAQVTSQYTTVDCGTVNVREYYGNVLDYAPYTEISLYLPFIGIVKLDVADVMRGSVQVKYHVDVITGACLADVIVKRDGESAVLYQYAGSAIVTYPVSSGSYASMVTGVLSLAAGVAGTIMTGGAAAPALIGGAVGLSHLHTDVQKSGGFSGSPGAMGGKKPYLIISRPQDATPTDFEKYEGKPASKTVVLGNCSGFVKVKQINIDAVPATYGEQDQIVALLKQGVIL